MFSSSASVFAVNHQARALCPQTASKERHRFLVGTCSLHEHNELSVLEYHEDSNAIDCPMVYSHPEQIWDIEPSPLDTSLVITNWQNGSGDMGSTLWRMSHQSADDIDNSEPGQYLGDRLDLDRVGDFTESSSISASSTSQNIKWHPTRDLVLLSNEDSVAVWAVGGESVKRVSSAKLPTDACSSLYVESSFAPASIAWDPHAPNSCAVGIYDQLNLVDTRTLSISTFVPKAHAGVIRDIDYNPNKPLTLVTAGDDRKVLFWDARNMKAPIKTLMGHTHWVWRVKFNPFHDQLLLSGSTDQSVVLWRIASCSSAPWLSSDAVELDGFPNSRDEDAADDALISGRIGASGDKGFGEADTNDPPDVKVRHMDQHEESVYSVAWSPSDAWVYASMSFDGRIILNHVPSTEKYKILL